jgi:hypothetical protein
MKKNKIIDIAESLQFFFKLPDWKERILWLGGASCVALLVYFLAFAFFLIPIIGWICGCFLIVAVGIFHFLFWIYVLGYQFEIIKAVASGEELTTVKPNEDYSERLRHGFRIFLGNLIQNVPTLILYLLSYALFFIPTILLAATQDSNNSSFDLASTFLAFIAIFGMLIGYIPMFLAWIYMMFQQFFMYPAAIFSYYREEKISAMLRFKEIWTFIKANWINLLLYLAIIFGIGIVMYMLGTISFFLIFLCIGIILAPLIWALGMTVIIHVQAHMLGQICKLNK